MQTLRRGDARGPGPPRTYPEMCVVRIRSIPRGKVKRNCELKRKTLLSANAPTRSVCYGHTQAITSDSDRMVAATAAYVRR